jgi:hypothetical protein
LDRLVENQEENVNKYLKKKQKQNKKINIYIKPIGKKKQFELKSYEEINFFFFLFCISFFFLLCACIINFSYFVSNNNFNGLFDIGIYKCKIICDAINKSNELNVL